MILSLPTTDHLPTTPITHHHNKPANPFARPFAFLACMPACLPHLNLFILLPEPPFDHPSIPSTHFKPASHPSPSHSGARRIESRLASSASQINYLSQAGHGKTETRAVPFHALPNLLSSLGRHFSDSAQGNNTQLAKPDKIPSQAHSTGLHCRPRNECVTKRLYPDSIGYFRRQAADRQQTGR